MIKPIRTMIAICLITIIVLSMPLTAFAGIMDDIRGHWAEDMIRYTAGKGILQGYPDGTFRPNNPMTQAEFITLINRSFGFDKKAEYKLSSVSPADWYAADFSRAKAQGYLDMLEDSMIMPKEPINRQTVSAILGKVLKLKPDESISNGFSDAGSFDIWSKGLSGAVSGYGYMTGYKDNTFRPDTNITRAEVSTILYRVVGELYDTAGIYGDDQIITRIKGNMTVNKPGITLKNMVIEGNLYLTEGIGTGAVTLDRVIVLGTSTICGGGAGVFLKDSSIAKVVVSTPDNLRTYLVAEGNTKVGTVEVQSGARLEELELTGTGFGEVVLSASNSANIELAGAFDRVWITQESSRVSILRGSIKLLEIDGKDTVIEIDESVRIETLTVNKPARVTGSCYVGIANINSSNVYIEARPKTVNIAAGLTGVYCIAAVTASSSGGKSSGGSGGGGSTAVKARSVEAIVDITVDNGTEKAAIGLPTMVRIILSDNSMRNVNVAWDNGLPLYNSEESGTYKFTGTLIMPSGVINPMGLTAVVNVIVRDAVVEEVTVTGIKPFSDINVEFGTDISVVKAVYLPGQAKVTLSTNETQDMDIAWDGGTPAYEGNTEGMYVFEGELTLLTGVTNPEDKKAEIRIIVGKPTLATVTDVDSITDINVDYGTAAGDIPLPGTVGISLSNGDGSKSAVLVWDTSGYDGNAAGTYTLYGTLVNLPAGVINSGNLKASVKVTVGDVFIVSIVEPAEIGVANGTAIDTIILPPSVTATLSDGTSADIDVSWDKSGYNGNIAATYIFPGTLTLPTGVFNSNSVQVSVKVTVGEPAVITVTEVDSIDSIIVDNGTALEAVGLPETVKIILSDGTTPEATVAWDGGMPGYDGNVAGTYVFSGTLTVPMGVEATSLKASVNVTVGDVFIVSIAEPTEVSVANGTAIETIILPPSVTTTLSDGTSVDIDVSWDTSGYNVNVAGTYTFPGTLTLPTGVLNSNSVAVSVKVIVANAVVTGVDAIADINVVNGTAIGSIGLPTVVKVTLNNGTTPEYGVTWDGGTPAYEANTAGTYVFSGTLTLPSGVEATSLNASVKVIVAMPVPTGTYTISSINLITQGMRVVITNLSNANYFNVYRISNDELVNPDNEPVSISCSLNTFTGVYNASDNLEIWVYSDLAGSNKIAVFTLSGDISSGTLVLK